MSSSTESFNQRLENLFRYYARLFTINETFMSHGLTLLSRYVNLQESTHQRIVFQAPSHVVHMANCRNIVYLKLWYDEPEAAERYSSRTLQLPLGTKLYVGQTSNPRARESSLQPYLLELGPPKSHICIGHGLSTYHKDALETATMTLCMFLHGLALLNRSPFSNNFYRNVSTLISVDDITDENYDSVAAFHNWRLTIIIGTAPSRTVFESFIYQDRRVTERTPFMDWDAFLPWGGLSRFRVLIGQTNPPPFIDHWPGEPCDLIDDWLRGKQVAQLEEADLEVKRSMSAAHRFLGVMLGARPTRLTPGQQVEWYLTTTCGTLTFANLQGDHKLAFLWLPHPAVCRYIKSKDLHILEQLFVSASQAIAAIEAKLFLLGVTSSSDGILSNQVQELRSWWIDHPYSKVLRCLSDNLSTMMASSHVEVEIPTIPATVFDPAYISLTTAPLLSLVPPSPAMLHELWFSLTIVSIPGNTENSEAIFNTRLQEIEEVGTDPVSVEGTTLFTLNKRFDSFIRKKASNSSEFELLTTQEQNEALQNQVVEYGLEMRRRFTRKQVRLGKFVQRADETELQAMDRCRSEFYRQRSRIPTRPGHILSTCLTCNDHLPRRDVTGRINFKVADGCSCGRTSFTSGWHFLPIVAEQGTYPASNLFVRHIQTLPSPLVISHRQLQASLVQFLEESDQRDPQGVILRERYRDLFSNLRSFRQQDSAQKKDLSNFSKGFIDTYRKLEDLTFNVDVGIVLDVRVISRRPLPIERTAYASSVSRTIHVFAIGYPQDLDLSDGFLLSQENLDYMNYREHLLAIADERRAQRRERDRAQSTGQARGRGRAR